MRENICRVNESGIASGSEMKEGELHEKDSHLYGQVEETCIAVIMAKGDEVQ